MKNRVRVIKELLAAFPNAAFIFGNGLTSREAAALADRPGNFYLLHAMGEAYNVGVGLKYARPDLEVVVIEGDGGAAMGMAGFSTRPAVGDLHYFVLCNGVYETTGGQALPMVTYGPLWMGIIEIEQGKWGETPNPPPPEFIKQRFQEWLKERGADENV